MDLVFKKMKKIKKALRGYMIHSETFDELYSLSNLLQDALDNKFEYIRLIISTNCKDALLSHTSYDNCSNTLLHCHMSIEDVGVYKEKSYSLSPKTPCMIG